MGAAVFSAMTVMPSGVCPGGCEKCEPHLAHGQNVAVFDLVRREPRIRSGAEDDLGPGLLRQLNMPAHKIRVRMGFDHVLDLLAVGVGLGDILLNVTLRVDDRPPPLDPR